MLGKFVIQSKGRSISNVERYCAQGANTHAEAKERLEDDFSISMPEICRLNEQEATKTTEIC